MSKTNVDDLYPEFRNLVASICYKFLNKMPGEDLEDLTQTAWENIVRRYDSFDPDKAELSTFIGVVSKSAMYDMLKALKTDKREIRHNSISLDSMTNGHDKYL